MKTQKIDKLAAEDAQRWAAAEMFYGEGAGTRRKLLNAEIEEKMFNMPGYMEVFNKVYDSLDMNKYAEMAIKERKSIDRMAKASQNFRAVKSGNLANLSNGIYIAAITGIVLHATGYDKVIIAESKKAYKKAKTEIKYRNAKRKGLNVEKLAG